MEPLFFLGGVAFGWGAVVSLAWVRRRQWWNRHYRSKLGFTADSHAHIPIELEPGHARCTICGEAI